MAHQQKALWLLTKQGRFEVGFKDIPKAGPGDLLVKIHSTGLNPVDWKIQAYGPPKIPVYPAVVGSDSAGTIEEVGEGVQGFIKGEPVLHQGSRTNDRSTFQQYVLVNAELAAKIPENVSFDQAASIPLGLATAAIGLYNVKEGNGIELEAPWKEGGRGRYSGKPIFISGGSTSVGQNVIQFAKLSGFSPIIATASPDNAELLISLGATHVIDRHESASLIHSKVSQITETPIEVVYDAFSSSDTQQISYDVLAPGGSLVLVLPQAFKEREGKKVLVAQVQGHPSTTPLLVGLYEHLTTFLKDESIKPNRVEVLSDGLAGIPDGLEKLKANKVSAAKLIARPQETT